MLRTGTAGWSLPRDVAREGSHLFTYSRALPCAEINSTFYRPHRPATWARWAAETPEDFRFSIKAPKAITHEAKLRETKLLLKTFLEQVALIGEKAGPILFQLPPSLGFDSIIAKDFFDTFRSLSGREAAIEPRSASWFEPDADRLLTEYRLARVVADPAKGGASAGEPGGDRTLVYYRLHGSPRTYYSSYEDDFLIRLADSVKGSENAWIIFDNTTLSHAYPNARKLQQLLSR
ncbi:MAG TPA: DUF72 domain-containing protein [Acidisarcina sp.]